MNDEAVWEMSPDVAELFASLAVKAIEETGRVLKLNVPLKADYHVGQNWAQIH